MEAGGFVQRLGLAGLFLVRGRVFGASGDGVVAFEPAGQVEIGAAAGAKGAEFVLLRLAADGTDSGVRLIRAGLVRRWGRHRSPPV